MGPISMVFFVINLAHAVDIRYVEECLVQRDRKFGPFIREMFLLELPGVFSPILHVRLFEIMDTGLPAKFFV